MVNEIKWEQRSYTKGEFISVWYSSKTKSDMLRKLGIPIAGGNLNTITRTAHVLGLTTDHLDRAWPVRIENPARKIASSSTAFTKESFLNTLAKNNYIANTHKIKLNLYRFEIKEAKCEDCDLIEWRGKPAPLALDHIDGDRSNNSLENLRILCYNCHGQTDTFSGKKNRDEAKIAIKKELAIAKAKELARNKEILSSKLLCSCGNKKSKESNTCNNCRIANEAIKVANRYPSISELVKMLEQSNYVKVAKEIGVSDNALKKHLLKRLPSDHPILNLRPRKNKP